ncbi:hypothetical protein B0H10DRAFT_722704 [Mycena sp. CBHHK59/15]|nr:hypothetical protein B0H10DRAFT_722704 [Mycena sp. CBHHK59/15]
MSLLFGSIYIIRFGTMRKMYKAASWADEAQKGNTSILWNVWILLAMPSVWLAWSILLFITCIMAFAWRTGAMNNPLDVPLSPPTARGLRIGISVMLSVALVYFFLILRTFRHYGDYMDEKWKKKVIEWAREGRYAQIGPHSGWNRSSLGSTRSRSVSPSSHSLPRHGPAVSGTPPSPIPISRPPRTNPPPRRPSQDDSLLMASIPSFRRRVTPARQFPPFDVIKVIQLRFNSSRTCPLPETLQDRDILLQDWSRFTVDLENVWDGKVTLTPAFSTDAVTESAGPQDDIAGLIHRWNRDFFFPRSTEAVLCREYSTLGSADSPDHSVYLMHLAADSVFGPLPEGLRRVIVIHFVEGKDHRRTRVQYQIDSGQVNSPINFNRLKANGLISISSHSQLRSSSSPSVPAARNSAGQGTSRHVPEPMSSVPPPYLTTPLPPSSAPASESPPILSPSPIRPNDPLFTYP